MAPHVKNAVQGSERVTDDIDALAENLEVSKPFSYRVTFDAMPEFRWKGPFKGVKVQVAAAGDEASIDAAAEAQFHAAVKEKSKLLLVAAARPEQPTLQLGDVAVVDFDVTRTVGDDEVRVPGAARAATQLDTATAEEALGLKGLVEGMVGMEVGTERAIPLTLPSNWMPEELAGAAVTAQVKVRELLFWQLPEKVDDAWAEAAYPGSETVAGLKRRLREAVAADVESKTSAKVQEAITTMLAEAVDAAVPESVLRELGEGKEFFFFFFPLPAKEKKETIGEKKNSTKKHHHQKKKNQKQPSTRPSSSSSRPRTASRSSRSRASPPRRISRSTSRPRGTFWKGSTGRSGRSTRFSTKKSCRFPSPRSRRSWRRPGASSRRRGRSLTPRGSRSRCGSRSRPPR